MSAKIITYRSLNADPDMAWMAFIETIKGRLGIYFTAPTEEQAKQKVRAFWAKEKSRQDRRLPPPKPATEQQASA